MPLDKKIQELLFDSRLLEKHLKEGKLDQKTLQKHLKSLKDLSKEYDEIDVEEILKEVQSAEGRKLPVGKAVETQQ